MAPATVLVTGANRGIGLALVKELLKKSEIRHIFAGARNPDQAEALHAIADTRLHIIKLDVECDDSIQNAYREIDGIVGELGLNVLINNAGIFVEYDTSDVPKRDSLSRVFNTNTASVAVISQILLPLLQRASKSSEEEMSFNRSANLIISSELGSIERNQKDYGRNDCLAYRISKAAVNQLARTLAIDFASEKIFTAAYSPGWVQTDMGGKEAELTPEQSASQLVGTWEKLTSEQNGGFYRRNGDVIPF